MAKSRQLSDLYVRGKSVTIDDGEGTPVEVYIRKLNPMEHEKALRKSNAARARVMAAVKDPDGDEYLQVQGDVYDMVPTQIVNYLVEEGLDDTRLVAEAEEENEKEWSEEDYLQGLRDSWNDVLSGRLQEDPEDAEALRVLKELERFTTKVDKRIEKERENLRSELELHSIEALREKTVETFLKTRANLLWLSEFRRAQLWLAVRQVNDHKAYYFTSRDEVDELPEEVLTILVRSYAELEVDTLEGKDSEEIPDSSPSPEQGPVAETVVSSSLSE